MKGHKYSIILLLLIAVGSCIQAQTVKAVLVRSGLILKDPPFKACHASTLVTLRDGKILAACFGGAYEGSNDVCIWTARFNGQQWTAPRKVAEGIINDTTRLACWNPVLFRTRQGRLFLFYKVGKSPRAWWGLMLQSTDEGAHWSAPEKLPDGLLGPIRNKPVQLKNGLILHPSSTESADEKQWQIHLEQSDSLGGHWKKIPIDCDTFGVIQPAVLSYPGNRLQLLSRSRQNAVVECWSTDGGQTWSKLAKTNLINPNSGIDAVTLKNGLQVLVYNPLAIGKEWFDGRSKLYVAVSRNGRDWQPVYMLENEQRGEFSYPAIIQSPDGLVHITYTYDRKNIKYVVLKIQ